MRGREPFQCGCKARPYSASGKSGAMTTIFSGVLRTLHACEAQQTSISLPCYGAVICSHVERLPVKSSLFLYTGCGTVFSFCGGVNNLDKGQGQWQVKPDAYESSHGGDGLPSKGMYLYSACVQLW